MRYPVKATAVLLALLASVVVLAACGSDEADTTSDRTGGESAATTTPGTASEKPKPVVPTIVVRDGEPVGGVAELEYDAGEQIRFTVRSEVADEIHVHGYDLAKDVPAGGSVSFSFPADIEGIFEVELEERVEQIAELTVNP